MSSDKRSDKKAEDGPTNASGKHSASPDWADGLKQLYDSVVEEPLPDAFKDLLAKLDDTGSQSAKNGAPPETGNNA